MVRTEQDWKDVYSIIETKAKSMGFGFESSDIAQSVIESWIAGRHPHQKIEHSIIDYIRSQYGRSGTKFNKYKYNQVMFSEFHHLKNDIYSDAKSITDRIDMVMMLNRLRGRQRLYVIFNLMGFTNSEIAEQFNIDKFSVGASIKRAFKTLMHGGNK